jgi:hypothetical protein
MTYISLVFLNKLQKVTLFCLDAEWLPEMHSYASLQDTNTYSYKDMTKSERTVHCNSQWPNSIWMLTDYHRCTCMQAYMTVVHVVTEIWLSRTPPLSTLFITLHSLKIMESLDNRFTSQLDFNIFYGSLTWLRFTFDLAISQ